ncbi:exopolyphosphatase [Angomonas deanei]|uniref:DHH family/DHHA2 domain containing protein, putative n=1 Tax=Angomonas deanei TaxID=59799 RepID=A0A7G2CSI9_9TRYP|nr:exopolyphosphatase [Angomonas deanei]CAD2221182.1 DHH family/DHHA2 domain containing protein, putative [Angomonas deanei]|eukprot:EPY42450.1 exopolyphosphatase [Angomonas deanei]
MGNEGGDMDSVIGSIYLAYLFDNKKSLGISNPVPLLNFPVEDVPLRNDVAKLLQELNIDHTKIGSAVQSGRGIFCNLRQLEPYVILYDHNKLNSSQEYLRNCVVGVVDHHFDEKLYKPTGQKINVNRTVGSACTLVVELFKREEVPIPCPQLLMAPIVLDTVNFDESQKKVTPADIAAFKYLNDAAESPVDATSLFTKLSTWKNDIMSLTVEQNLKRDYKHFDFALPYGKLSTGISSVPCARSQFEENYSLQKVYDSCARFLTKNELEFLIIAFAGKVGGVHSRQVLFFGPEENLEYFVAYAESSPSGIAFTKEISLTDTRLTLISYSLSDASVSRKRLAPSLADFLSKGVSSL